MQINLKAFLRRCGIAEMFYPGKRVVRPCRQEGAFKSHAVVLDWRRPDRIRIDVEAGLLGRRLPLEDLRNYPPSLQAPTYVEIAVHGHAQEDEGDGEGEGQASGSGSSGSGGYTMAHAFSQRAEGRIPAVGEVMEMVVMGVQLAAEAFGQALDAFAEQVAHARVAATDILAAAGRIVTRYTPPPFMEPRGDEQAVYVYSAEKNADIGRWSPKPG
jgi:hypothetical protein